MTTETDLLAAAGIPVYRPDTSPEAIAEGLAHGYIVPTTPAAKIHTAPTSSPSATATASSAATSTPSPPPGDSGGTYAPGTKVRVEGIPGQWVVAQAMPGTGTQLMLWNPGGKMRVDCSKCKPAHGAPAPERLSEIAIDWLHELTAVLGPEQVQVLLGEVA